MASYLINRDGEQFGPYSEEDFLAYIKSGNIQLTDLVWKDGSPEWLTVSDQVKIIGPASSEPAKDFNLHLQNDDQPNQALARLSAAADFLGNHKILRMILFSFGGFLILCIMMVFVAKTDPDGFENAVSKKNGQDKSALSGIDKEANDFAVSEMRHRISLCGDSGEYVVAFGASGLLSLQSESVKKVTKNYEIFRKIASGENVILDMGDQEPITESDRMNGVEYPWRRFYFEYNYSVFKPFQSDSWIDRKPGNDLMPIFYLSVKKVNGKWDHDSYDKGHDMGNPDCRLFDLSSYNPKSK